MSWRTRYLFRQFLRSSLWVMPFVSMALALVLAPLVREIDEQTQWVLLDYGPSGAQAMVAALSSSLLTLIVFGFSILLLTVQVAGGQLSPRIIARTFENRLTRVAMSYYVFVYTYSLAALGRVEDRVPQLPVLLVALLTLFGLALFINLIQRGSEWFRPISILTALADDTRAVVETLYPRPFVPGVEELAGSPPDVALAQRSVSYRGRAGVLLAIDVEGLVDTATKAGCIIELVPEVGDFLAPNSELFRIYGAGAPSVDEQALGHRFVTGAERTLQQDPAFGLRMITDIASKALSPAINDPTTGVLAIDQVEQLLHLIGNRQLSSGVVCDRSGEVRLLYRSPAWEDFVTLAVTEIRIYGGTSPQVTRRLRAMLEYLLEALPLERAPAIEAEMARLQDTIDLSYAIAEDRRLAAIADRQGFGHRQAPHPAANGGRLPPEPSERQG
jgi:uncharacterized membrane protein